MQINTIKIKCLENEFTQNTYLIELENYCVVIDAGYPLEKMKLITSKPIKAVLLTHGHFDHINHIEEYDKENILIYASKYLKEILNDTRKNASLLFNQPHKFNVKNLKCVEDNEEIEVDNHRIKCFNTQGHSIDSMCYVIDDEILFSGDTVFSNSVGRDDLPTGDKKELIKSLNRVLNLDYKILYSGHGIPSDKEEQKRNIPNFIDYLV